MGLFDTVHCEHPLPDGRAGLREHRFQTQSLGCTLETFVISSTGRLLRADGTDTGFHGVMHFHTEDSADRWLEYEAKFTDGSLQHLLPLARAAYNPEGMRLQTEEPTP